MDEQVTDAGSNINLVLDAPARAKLRRIDPFEVKEAYAWARHAASHPSLAQLEQPRLVKLAALAATVRENSPRRLGAALRSSGVNERHVRRLLACDRSDIEEQLNRMVRLLGRKANVVDLVATAAYWGEKAKRGVAIDYFGVQEDAK
jgi:hypothetical protein